MATHMASSDSQNQAASAASTSPKSAIDYWLECVRQWYPHRHKQTYFLPPQFFRRQLHSIETVSDQAVLVHESKSSGKRAKIEHYPPQSTSQPYCSQPVSQSTILQSTPGQVWTQNQGLPAPLPNYIQSDDIDDDATEHLLSCLRFLGNPKHSGGSIAGRQGIAVNGMVVISQLQFRKYLDNQTHPVAAASSSNSYCNNNTNYNVISNQNCGACPRLPCLSSLGPKYAEGDFDVLVVHSKCGLITMELKAIGAAAGSSPDGNKVKQRVQKALSQLDKAETVLTHLTSNKVNVCKTLVMAGITSDQLKQALETDKALEQELVRCLAASDSFDAINRCLCADSMPTMQELDLLQSKDDGSKDSEQQQNPPTAGISISPPSSALSETPEKKQRLLAWWKLLTEENSTVQQAVTEQDYDRLLARFCGPATTVEIPTVTAPRLAIPGKKNKFTPSTKVIRTEGEAAAETGLILSRLTLFPEQVAILNNPELQSLYLYGPPGTGKTVMLVLKGIEWLNKGYSVLLYSSRGADKQSASERKTCMPAIQFLIKKQLEHSFHSSASRVQIRHFNNFGKENMEKLVAKAQAGKLHILADECNRDDFNFWNKVKPQVQEMNVWCACVEELKHRLPEWMNFEKITTPLRTTPRVTKEILKSGEFKPGGKRVRDPVIRYTQLFPNCATQGPEMILLKHYPAHKGKPVECEICAKDVAKLFDQLDVNKPGDNNLKYKDVFVLTNSLPKFIPFVDALRSLGIPVKVLRPDDSDDAREVVACALNDEVTVSQSRLVAGLERRLVIGLGDNAKAISGDDRLHAISRCSSQLVWIV